MALFSASEGNGGECMPLGIVGGCQLISLFDHLVKEEAKSMLMVVLVVMMEHKLTSILAFADWLV